MIKFNEYSLEELIKIQEEIKQEIEKKEECVDFNYKEGTCFYKKQQKGFTIFSLEYIGTECVYYYTITADSCNNIRKEKFSTTKQKFKTLVLNLNQVDPIVLNMYSDYIDNMKTLSSNFVKDIYKSLKR